MSIIYVAPLGFLMISCLFSRADYRMAKLLLSRGAQANDVDITDNSPLHVATIFGHMELVKLLLHHGSDVYKKGQHGAIPIHIAAREGHANLVRLFCQHEVNANIKVPCYDAKDKAPIHVAAERGHAETVFALLQCCHAAVDVRDSEGETPLHSCVINEYDPLGMKSKDDYTETVKVLINNGANVNIRNARGETPLHLAARNEFQKIIEVLVLAGCDPLINDNDNNKAVDLVSDDDTVSKQTLKSAMEDRERFMNESFEVRSKGFVTSIQPQLPLSIKSQSILSMPLLNNSQSIGGMSRATSIPGLFAPQMSPLILPDDGYLNPLRSMNPNLNPFANVMQSSIFSPSSIVSSNQDTARSFAIREEDELNSEASIQVPSTMSDRFSQISKISLAPSSEKRPKAHKPPPVAGAGLKAKRGYPESETSSLWEVTPNPSVSIYNFDEHEVETLQKLRKAERSAARRADASSKQTKPTPPEKPKKPLKFIPVNKAPSSNGVPPTEDITDDDTFFDDASFDTISSSWLDDNTQAQGRPTATTITEMSGSQNSLHEWLAAQAEISGKQRKNNNSTGSSDCSTTNSDHPSRPPPRVRHPSSSSSDTVKRRNPPPIPAESKPGKKNRAKLCVQNRGSDTEKVIEVQIDDTQVPGQTVFRVIPVNPPGPSRTEVVPTRAAEKAISQLDDDSFVDMLSQSDFSWADSVSQRSDFTDGRASTVYSLKPGKNSKSYVFVRHSKNKNKGSRRWERTVKTPTNGHQKEREKQPSNTQRNGAVKSAKAQQRQATKTSPTTENSGKKSVVSKVPMPSESSSSSSNSSDDDTVVSARQVNKSAKFTSKNAPPAPKKENGMVPNGILKNSSPQHATSPTFLYPVQSQLIKHPMSMAQPSLVFQRPNAVAESKDSISKDYMFHKTMGSLNSASAEDILEQISHKSAVQNSFHNGNYLLNSSMMSEHHPSVSENRLSGGSYGTAEFPTSLMMQQPYQQNQLQSLHPIDMMQMELKRQHEMQMHQLEYRRQQELQMQQFQQQRLELNRYQEMQRLQVLQEQEMLRQQQQEQKILASKKRTKDAGGSQPSSQLYEELPDGNSEKHVSIASEEYIPGNSSASGKGIRALTYSGDGKLGCTLCGGNNVGVFVSAVEESSHIKRSGLGVGDQILKINGHNIKGRTKEEVAQMLQKMGQLHLTVEFKSMKFNAVAAGERPGDHLHVLAHFNYTTTKKDELCVREDEIFLISDTFPDDHVGFWLAKKVRSSVSSEVDQVGFIPNEQAAQLILVKKDLTENKNADKRGGAFKRSFRRSKSMERIGKGKEMPPANPMVSNVVAYERVVQTTEEARRPVVIMGLFCGSVRDMLVRDSPGLFEVPSVEVERRNNDQDGTNASEATAPVVNERVIQAIRNKDKHCLMIISPKAVEYLRQNTTLHPIVIYMSPVSKNIVKVVHAKLEPNVNRKPAFMFEEANKFEKANTGLFSAIVPYKADATWFSLLKDTIDRIQKLPKWEVAKDETDSDVAERDSPDIIRTTKRSSGHDSDRHRVSKSTDDIPDQIQDLLNRHTYGKVERRSKPRENGNAGGSSHETHMRNGKGQNMDGRSNDGDILKYLESDDEILDDRQISEQRTGRSQQRSGRGMGQVMMARSSKGSNNSSKNDVTQKRNAKNASVSSSLSC